jgi:hypothetical protein
MVRDVLGDASAIPTYEDVPPIAPPTPIPMRDVRNNALPAAGTPGLDNDALIKDAMSLRQATQPKEHVWSGTGKAAAAGAAGLGAQIAGAGEYAASRAFGQNDYVTQAIRTGRQAAQQFAQDEVHKLTPQEQDEMSRQWTTLDPHQTIWQGGPSEFVHSLLLQSSQAAPAAIATIWPMGRMVKAGMTNGALAYVGATQAGLSMGQIANNISDDISSADEETLRRNSPKYAQLIAQGTDPATARQDLIREAQKYAPVIGGVVSGAISTLAGRFLTPVLSKEGASLGARLAGGAADQALQQGGTAATDYIARETAAHTYDSGRAPDLSGAASAATEGAVTGAVVGAAFGALAGHGKRPSQPELSANNQNPGEQHSTMEGTPENKATGAATESHTSMGPTDEYEPTERNREGFETLAGETPRIITPGSGQAEMDLPQGVAPDQALAIQARHEVAHWGEEQGSGYRGAPPPEPAPPPAPNGMQEPNGPQGNLDLRGGQMNPPPGPPVAQPAQFNLPLRTRQRGGVDQLPLTSPPVEAPQQTRADELRARANPDWDQPDLLRDNPVPGQLTTRTNRPMVRGTPDQPTAEPFGDIQAQLRDLRDPTHERGGVYLSADNMESLRRRDLLERVRDEAGPDAEPMVNFDEKGGALIAKTPEHAAQYAAMRDQKAGSLQEILGAATGAGAGKPGEGNLVVQQHDDQGNVTRETVAGSPEEAQQLQQQYTDHARGRTAVVTTVPAAVLRRAQLIGLESEHQQRASAEKGASREVDRSLDRSIGNGTRAESLRARAIRAAHSDVVSGESSPARSREEAARRLTAEARNVHNEEAARAKSGIGVLRPDDLVFANESAAKEYRRMYSDVMDTHLISEMGGTEEIRAHARAGIAPGERSLQAFIKTHKPETRSAQLARAAVETSREGVKEYLADKRAPGRQYVEPHQQVDTDVLPPPPRPTRAEVHEMNEHQLSSLYDEVVNRTAHNPALHSEKLVDQDYDLAKGRSAENARPKLTREQMYAEDEGVRSKQERRINRYFRSQERREEMGSAKSEGFSVSPRRALTEREEQLNRAKTGKQRRLIGYRTFDPEALMHTVESQREMERSARLSPEEARAERVQHFKDLGNAIDRGEKHLDEMMPLKREHIKNGESPLMAQRYMRELLQYGRALRSQSLRSPEARSAAKKFNTLMQTLGNKSPIKRAEYLINTFKTELARQDRSGARANPERGSGQDTLAERVASRNEALNETESERAARVAEGNPDAFVNAMDREIAAENIRAGIRPEPLAPENRTLDPYKRQPMLPFETAPQPKFGYEGAGRPEEVPPADHGEAPKQEEYPLGYRSVGQQFAREGRGQVPYTRNAEAHASRIGSALGELLEHARQQGGPVYGDKIVHEVLSNLRPGNPMHDLFTKLSNVIGRDTLVGYAGHETFGNSTLYGNVKFAPQGPEIRINRNHLEYLRATGRSPEAELAYTVAHELVHVATSGEIFKNPRLAEQLRGYLALAREHGTAAEHYGLTNEHEMVAEAYTDAKFRQFLRDIPAPHNESLFDHVWRFLKSVLGMDKNPETSNLFDRIMSHEQEMFTGRRFVQTEGGKHVAELNRDDVDGHHVANGYDRVLKSLKLDRATMKDMAKGGQGLLSAMTPRQMREQFGKWFESPTGNPYHRYWDTYFKRAADNAVSMEKVGKLSNAWSNLEDKYGADTANKVSKLMHDATVYAFHPELALDHADNEHLVSVEQKQRQRDGAAVYNSLPAEWQDHYRTMKRYYANEQRNTTDQIVLNGLHAMLTKGEDAAMSPKDFDAQYNTEAVRRLGLDTEEGLTKEFGNKLDGASIDTLAKIGTLTNKPGPYFPLMRNGDYVVSAERKLGTKTFTDGAEARKFMSEQRAKDPTLTVSLKVGEDGEYNVSTSEKEFRMAESRSEANQHRRDMVAQYGEGNVKPVQLKANLYKGESSITTGSALDKILGKLDDNPAAQAAIKDFYLRSLGDQSFRKRELTRQNRRGVAVENQHRSFTQYGRSQSYYLSQLKHGRHLANAQGEVQAAVDAHRDESQISAVRLGQIARELSLRDELSRNPYEVADWVKKGTGLTQFMMITSPSHWFVRGAQPYVLTAPWLGARHGYAESVAALGRAQSMIADPLLKESANSALGLKALFSRTAAEKSFSVMDQVMDYVKQRGGADAASINAMLQHLRDNNLIDLSMATELSDISKGKSTGLAARVLDASRVMLHLIEVNNRVMTAIAARELGIKQGMTEAQAVEHAADAINVTHNDYSYGNTPRLFMAQAKGLLGGARPMLFQFMKYPQQVYGMMISSGLAALKGKTPAERAIGLKTLMGVFATHLLAAGAVGATIQPIKWAMGALMAGASAAGLTDEPYTIPNALSGDTYDHMLRGVMNDLFGTELGELASKGLPTALGLDLSQRMALGSTYSFHLKTDSDSSTLGSILESVGGPWLNVAENFYDSGRKFLSGDAIGGAEGMSPHIIRDLVKAGAMTQQGVMDNAGHTLIPADKLSAPQIFAQSLGFRPDAVAEMQARRTAERNEQQNIVDRQRELLNRYARTEGDERQEVYNDVRDFNAKHPGFAIDTSALMRARAARMASDQQLQQYGIRAKNRQLPELLKEGERYNVQ